MCQVYLVMKTNEKITVLLGIRNDGLVTRVQRNKPKTTRMNTTAMDCLAINPAGKNTASAKSVINHFAASTFSENFFPILTLLIISV